MGLGEQGGAGGLTSPLESRAAPDGVPTDERATSQLSVMDPRVRTTLFTGFAVLAFVLSAVGDYGVMSYTVRQRLHDIGIRMALGASAPRVLRETLLGGMGPVLAGMIGGLALSLLATNALSAILFEVEANWTLPRMRS